MSARALALGRPHAARAVARDLLELAGLASEAKPQAEVEVPAGPSTLYFDAREVA